MKTISHHCQKIAENYRKNKIALERLHLEREAMIESKYSESVYVLHHCQNIAFSFRIFISINRTEHINNIVICKWGMVYILPGLGFSKGLSYFFSCFQVI